MINTPPPLKGLNIRILIMIPIKGRGFIHQGFTLFEIWEAAALLVRSARFAGRMPGRVSYRFSVGNKGIHGPRCKLIPI